MRSPFAVASLALLVAFIASPPVVHGAERDSTRALGVADTVTVLRPVEVHGQRSLDAGRTTGTAVRLDRAKLVRFQPATTGDALQSAPGVDIVRTGAWDSRISVRGLTGERVLVMVDGVRLQTGRGHGAQTSLVPVDQLESFELLPGGGSAQFGSDALGAVVNLVTHRSLFAAEPRTTLTLTGRASTPGDGESAHARLRVLHSRFGVELSGGLDRLGAVVTPLNRLPDSGHHDQDLGGRAALQVSAATLDYEHSRHAAYDIGLPAFFSAAGSRASYPLQSRDADRFELSLPEHGARPEARLLAVQQRFITEYDELNKDSLFVRRVLRGFAANDASDRIVTWAQSLQPSLRSGPLRLYGEWRREHTSGPRTTTRTTTSPAGATLASSVTPGESMPNARRTVLAAGAALGVTRWGVRAELGARYDHNHAQADSTQYSFTSALDATDHRTSFDGGLSRRFGGWEPYAHIGTGFRSPNLEERYYNDNVHGGMRVFGNPALRAERSLTSEGGLRGVELLGGHLTTLRASAYRTEVEDMITIKYFDMLYGVPRFQYQNVHRARLEGIEIQADTRCGFVQLNAAASFPRGRDVATGKRLLDVGAAHAVFDLRIPVPRVLPQASLTLRTRWNDATVNDGQQQPSGPAFWLGSAEVVSVWNDTRVALAVINLTNEYYQDSMSFIPSPGRTWSLAVRRDLSPRWLAAH